LIEKGLCSQLMETMARNNDDINDAAHLKLKVMHVNDERDLFAVCDKAILDAFSDSDQAFKHFCASPTNYDSILKQIRM
jgi:hypothetical protein